MRPAPLLFGILLAFSLLTFQCEDDTATTPEPGPSANYARLDVVTGLDFYDQNGQPIGRWGFPNHRPGEVRIFPNPSTGILAVNSPEDLLRVWLIPAGCITDSVTTDIPGLSANLSYSITDLNAAQQQRLTLPIATRQANLNFEAAPAGFYRLFCELASREIYWQNLYIDPAVSNISDFLEIAASGCD